MQLEHLISKTLNEDWYEDREKELNHPALDHLSDYYNTHLLVHAADKLGYDSLSSEAGSKADDHLAAAKTVFEQNKAEYPNTTWENLVSHAHNLSSLETDNIHSSVKNDLKD